MATQTVVVGGGNWSAGATWSTGSVPAAGDDVVVAATSGNLTIDVNTNTIRSFIESVGYAGTITHNAAVTLNIGGASAPVGNIAVTLLGGSTYTILNATTSAISIADTSAATNTYNFAGKTLGNVTINNGTTTTTQLSTNGFTIGATAIVTLTQGKFDTNGQTCSWGFFSSTGSATRTLAMGSSAITITGGSGAVWNTVGSGTITGLTISTNTAIVTMTGTAANFRGGNINYNGTSLVYSGNGLGGTGGDTFGTFNNVTYTGSASKLCQFYLGSNLTVTGTLTITGNSATNRVLVFNLTAIGTPITITAAAVSITNCDFQDITGAGAASPFTGTSLGNCQGNSGITFDTPVTQTATGTASFTWSTHGWTTRVPLPQDNVVVNNAFVAGRTVTMDMPRLGKNIDFSGATGAPIISWGSNLSSFGDITMAANVLPAGGTFVWNLAGRGSQTITNNGVTWQNATRLTVNGFGGTYTLADAYVAAASGGPSIFTVTTGTFNTANFNMTPGTFTVNTGATATLGTSTITLNSTITGTIVTVSATATLSAASSTFSITANSLSQTFAGGGKTFGNLTVTGTQASQLIITGANTFNTVTSGEGVQLTMPASTTNTLTTLNAVGRNYGYQYLPGLGFNYVSAPDSAPLSITSDLTVDIKVALANWSPATFPGLIGKNGNTTTQASYAFFINSSGNKLFFQSSANGSTIISHTSTVGTGFANNSTNWVRACIKCDNGAAGHDVEFYTSADGSTWAKLGATVTTAGTTSIFDSPAVLEIGSNTNGTANTPVGNFYEARVYNSYLQASNGTPVFDANFATKTVGNNTFTESSANAATVTINGAQAQVGDGRIGINSSIAATSGTISSTNVVAGDYLVVKDSTAAGNTPFYAGSHGILVSNNTNWSATNAPTGTSNLLLIGAG